ncbi:unnamed protein product [Eruca vesicaria subsp. sativa]|uniref:Complex 1 LYR protein domain-containing protein n=1 Tax=Eruca vesicaria subsp. sativa TaxID=29727 RepID=A0ABC8LNP2_ERUVS|nr:unnamed protein product [Eruca vesicaria subsp. sativa]
MSCCFWFFYLRSQSIKSILIFQKCGKRGLQLLSLQQKAHKSQIQLSRLCTKNMVCFLYAKSSLLGAERQYPDYNIREYTKRRILDGFRMNKNLTDPSNVEASAEG